MKIYMVFGLLCIASSIFALGKHDKQQQISSAKKDIQKYFEDKQSRDRKYKRNAIHNKINTQQKAKDPWTPPRKKPTT